MAQMKFAGGGALIAALLASTAAQADITAAEVWQSWKDYYGAAGYTITAGNEAKSGDTLTVSDVVAETTTPEGNATVTVSKIMFQESGGKVIVTLPPEMPMVASGKGEDDQTFEMTLNITNSGLGLTVSGAPDDMVYDLVADSVGLSVGSMKANGEPIDMTLNAVAAGIAGQSRVKTASGHDITQDMSAKSVKFDLAATDPESGGTVNMTGKAADLRGGGTAFLPKDAGNMQDINLALKSGFRFDSRIDHGAADYAMKFVDAGATTETSGSETGGSFAVKMGSEGMTYAVSGQGAVFDMMSPQVPFPVHLTFADTGFALKMPLTKSEGGSDFGLMLKLLDFTVSDEVWGMFDPMSQLPRDPMTLLVDLSGKAKVMHDLLDPAMAEQPGAPGELQALTLNDLKLKVAGAELTGAGDFTFDNSDTTTFEGMPRPLGSASFRLLGGNGLLDKLVKMGFVPEDQAMGVRMMAGLFANAGPGEDELNSTIEVKADGGLYANGQRLK